MIKRERLKELIDKGETIYFVYNGNVDEKEGIYKGDFILNETYVSIYWTTRSHQIKYKDLYETKSEAEWVAKMHTQRTEYFEPPTWKQFEKQHKPYHFISKGGLRETIYIFDKNVNNKLLSAGSKLFGKPTKESYIKACEYARNLFLGKENDNETDSDR